MTFPLENIGRATPKWSHPRHGERRQQKDVFVDDVPAWEFDESIGIWNRYVLGIRWTYVYLKELYRRSSMKICEHLERGNFEKSMKIKENQFSLYYVFQAIMFRVLPQDHFLI